LPGAPYRTHLDDLDWQRTGAVTVVIAWHDSVPVGSGLIHWPGPRDPSIATLLPMCPEIFRLEIVESHRSTGVGTALIRELDTLVRARRLPRVGLGVGIANQRARVLYERLGYRPVDGAEYIDRSEIPDSDGQRYTVEEPCIFMVRDVGPERGEQTLLSQPPAGGCAHALPELWLR